MSLTKLDKPAYVLRTCNAYRISYGGFQWPTSGHVECPDWNPEPICRGGLYGLLWGAGNSTLLNWSADALWLAIEIHEYVDLDGKVKFPSGNVVFCGSRTEAVANILAKGANLATCVGTTQIGGDHSTFIGSDRVTLIGGNYSTLTGGKYSTITGGDRSKLTGENDSTIIGGNESILTGGYWSILTAGNGSTLNFRYWDVFSNSFKVAVGYVGKEGLLANCAYNIFDGKIVPV